LSVFAITAKAQGAAQLGTKTETAALTVTVITPQAHTWPVTLTAYGNVTAWQEAMIGAELSHYRLTAVLVSVGDVVRQGQVLARIDKDTVTAALNQSQAALTQAQAQLAEAQANAKRARELQLSGILSEQGAQQLITKEQTALAQVRAAHAQVQVDRVRLSQTEIRAPDAGMISERTAAVGSLTQPGQTLFKLIRKGRLEWRAEVGSQELAHLKPGMSAIMNAPGGATVKGKVRTVAPTVNAQTRTGIVYVDLPKDAAQLRAGMFVQGQFELEKSGALTLPNTAVMVRDGFSYIFILEDNGQRVRQKKISTGRRYKDQIEITEGIDERTRVVDSGVAFLVDGDTVRVVEHMAKRPQ